MSSRRSVDRAPRPVLGRSWHRFRFLSGTQIFLCPTLALCWIFHPSYLFTQLKIHHLHSLLTTHDKLGSADPSSMQDTCHIWNSVKMALLSTSSRSSVDRAPDRCSGGHGFDSCRRLRFFFVPTLASCWILPSSKFTIFIYFSMSPIVCNKTESHRGFSNNFLTVDKRSFSRVYPALSRKDKR